MKKLKQKKAFGGKIENPNTALVRNQIALANAEAEAGANPWVIGLNAVGTMAMEYGTSMMSQGAANGEAGAEGASGLTKTLGNNQGSFTSLLGMLGAGSQFAMGGTVGSVPVEVEGNEVAETPNGNLLDFVGPSHEQGGIDTNLPQGTEVYSDRITKDGKTMAQRKKSRERVEQKLQKKSSDTLMRNTLKRVTQKNAMEDSIDKTIQDMVGNFESTGKMALGGTVGDPPKKTPQQIIAEALSNISTSFNPDGGFPNEELDEIVIEVPAKNKPVTALQPLKTEMQMPALAEPTSSANPLPLADTSATPVEAKTPMNLPSLGMTLGDMLGVGGNAYSAIKGANNTHQNRAGDTPNINAYENFGEDGLEALQKAMGFVQGMSDEARMNTRVAGNTARKANRNSARGVNTQRALDLATYSKEVDADNNIKVNEANQMMNLLTQVAQAENQQDQMVMQGDAVRDMNDRKDRDAYFSNMASDIKTTGSAITQTGNALNNSKERQVTGDLLNSMSPYAEVDPLTGNITYKDQSKNTFRSQIQAENRKLLTDEQIASGNWADMTNPTTGDAFTSAEEYKVYRTAIKSMALGKTNVDKIPLSDTKKTTKK